jgi:hypothetical protein
VPDAHHFRVVYFRAARTRITEGGSDSVHAATHPVHRRRFISQPRLPQIEGCLLILPRVVQPPSIMDESIAPPDSHLRVYLNLAWDGQFLGQSTGYLVNHSLTWAHRSSRGRAVSW